MPYMIFDLRLARCASSLSSFPDIYRLEAPPPQTLLHSRRRPTTNDQQQRRRRRRRATKKICCYLDNNRGNYLGDNNLRSSASDSCRWLSYSRVWRHSDTPTPILVTRVQTVITETVTIVVVPIFFFQFFFFSPA